MNKLIHILVLLLVAAPAVSAATFNVTKTTDTADGTCDADCSLREAVIAANTLADSDTINLPVGVYLLNRTGFNEDSADTGDLDLLNPVTVVGVSPATTIIDGNGTDRVFDVFTAVVANLSALTIRNGNAFATDGGGIRNEDGTVTVSDVTISGNVAKNGGGLANIGSSGSFTLDAATLSGNTGEKGGAIRSSSGGNRVWATNVTISGNTATDEGGGLAIDHVSLTNATITLNTAPPGKGSGINDRGSQPATLLNTIVANNTNDECSGTIVDAGGNLDDDGTCGVALTANPLLGPLRDNGGPTETHALLTGSPAIDGVPSGCPPPGTDQRGVARPFDGDADLTPYCDMGAFESDVVPLILSGTIYEDTNGDADLTVDTGVNNVTVEIWMDDGDGSPDAGDTSVGSTTTDVSGDYQIGLGGSQTYWVVVDSKTLGAADVWAEQTYGPAGALCADGQAVPGVLPPRATAGPCYAGRRADGTSASSDDASALTSAEHVARVAVGTSDVGGLDFAFSFNVVTSERDADDSADSDRYAQGSLRQMMQNANALAGSNVMRFVPVSHPNAGGNTWWGVVLSGSLGALPAITGAGTTIDGTAYCAWDGGTVPCTGTTNERDTNSGQSGNPDFLLTDKNVGTGPDGLEETTGDNLTLPDYENPELEVDINDQGLGFDVQAGNVILKRVALFNNESHPQGVIFNAGTGGLITECFIGLRADGTDPGLYVAHAVQVDGGAADIIGNLIAHATDQAVEILNTSTINGNEIYGVSMASFKDDLVSVDKSSGQTIIIRGNRLDTAPGFAIETWEAPGPFVIEDNTMRRTGLVASEETGGMRIYGTGSTIQRNVVEQATGAGILLIQEAGANQQNRISMNSIHDNGGLGIDITVDESTNPDGDGVTPNNGTTNASVPNNDMDYPVITSALIAGSTLRVAGYVGTASAKIAGTHDLEFFKADNDLNNNGEIEAGDGLSVAHGEGRWYAGGCTSNADGTFLCDIAVPAGLSLSAGDPITATATGTAGSPSRDNTSEFSANVTLVAAFAIRGTVFEDVNYGGGIGRDLAAAQTDAPSFTVERGNVTVELYDAVGSFVASTTTAVADGTYTFTVLPAGNYTVRVVNNTVTSSRPGSDGSELGVQTYRVDGVSEAAGDGAKKVGGELPSNEDAAANSGAQTLASLQGTDLDADGVTEWTQSIVTVDASAGDVTGVDFGFNFDIVVNNNDAGQGTLRQFILNSNLLN